MLQNKRLFLNDKDNKIISAKTPLITNADVTYNL